MSNFPTNKQGLSRQIVMKEKKLSPHG